MWRWASWSLCQCLRGFDLCLSLTSSAHSLWLICSCPAAVTPPSRFPAAPSSKATRNVTAGRRTSPFIKSAHWALLLIAGNWWCVDLVPQSIKELKIDSHLTYVGVNVSWVNGTINRLILQFQRWNRCGPMTFDNIRVLGIDMRKLWICKVNKNSFSSQFHTFKNETCSWMIFQLTLKG